MRILILLCVLVTNAALAQSVIQQNGELFYFYQHEDSNEQELVRSTVETSDPLGPEVAFQKALFNDRYTKVVPAVGAYSQSKRVIHKNDIYRALRILDRKVRKMVSMQEISLKEGSMLLEQYYGIANEIYDKDTTRLEAELKNVKKDIGRISQLLVNYKSNLGE
jgi:hypothetical protein